MGMPPEIEAARAGSCVSKNIPVKPISTKRRERRPIDAAAAHRGGEVREDRLGDGQIKGEKRIDQNLQHGILHDAVQPSGKEARRGVEQQRQNKERGDAEQQPRKTFERMIVKVATARKRAMMTTQAMPTI